MPPNTPTAIRASIRHLFDKDLVFLAGLPKSGTTWLQMLLDSHPKIVCKGESHFVDIFYVELNRQLNQYNQLVLQQGGIVAHLKKYGGHVDSLQYNMDDANYLLVVAIGLMFSKWLGNAEIEVIGEKTPDNIQYISLLAAIFPKAKFIHIVRDPRDCAVSSWFFSCSNLDKNKMLNQSFDEHILHYADYWQQHIVSGRTSGMELGERYTEIYFEDLVEHPTAQLKNIISFLDVATTNDELHRCVSSTSFSSQTGGRKPGQEAPDAFLRKGIVGDWRNHFGQSLNDQFATIAGKSMKRFGYSIS